MKMRKKNKRVGFEDHVMWRSPKGVKTYVSVQITRWIRQLPSTGETGSKNKPQNAISCDCPERAPSKPLRLAWIWLQRWIGGLSDHFLKFQYLILTGVDAFLETLAIFFNCSVYRQLRILAFSRKTWTGEWLIFYDPKFIAVIEREFFVDINIASSKKSDAWKFQILVIDVNFDRDQIRIAWMINEPCNIAVTTGVDAIGFSILYLNREEKSEKCNQ